MVAQNMGQDPYKYFRVEARDLLDQFAKGILEIEKSGSGTHAVQKLLRLAHTLKGAARVVKQSDIADRAHAIEDTLSLLRDGTDGVAREQIDTILAHLDEIDSQVVTLVPADGAAPPVQGKSGADEGGPRTIRTDIAETDAVLDGVAETYALLNGLRAAAHGAE
jgi:two-component system, chemotaxis family, sensor kinase CheA